MEIKSDQNYLKKELYELIKEDEDIFDFIQSSSLDGLWYWDLDQPENEWMSPKFWTVLGYNPAEMPHKSNAWQDIINPEDLQDALIQFQKHCEDPNFPYDQIVRYTHKNGSIVWIRCRGIVIRDDNGRPLRMLGAHHDITEIKNTEIELIRSKEIYEGLLNNLSAGIIVHEADTSIKFHNQKAEELLGLKEIQIIGKMAIDPQWQFFDENNNLMSVENYPVNLILKNKKPLKDYIVGTYNSISKDINWLFVNGFPVLDENNEVLEVLISFIDFTSRKKAEENLKIAKNKAEESDRIKTVFLQNISHEIRTPLNAICGFTKMLNQPEITDDKKKHFVSIIENSSEQLLSIINDILTLSSLEANQEIINKQKVNLNHILEELLAIFKNVAKGEDVIINVHKNLDDIHSEIFIDKTKLIQVLSNLLTNAQKFTHEGSIDFGYNYVNNELEFFVKDTGIGIKKELHKKIFDRFTQADLSLTKNYGGTGLGLAISKGFVDLLGGKIWVDSEENKGANFYFTIPYEPVNS